MCSHSVCKKSSGKIELITGIYLIIVLVILLSAQTQIRVLMAAGSYVEDALAASNLASAVADYREYGRSGRIVITDPKAAYRLYCDALRQNLCLDENWKSSRHGLISGQVKVLMYEVYVVEDNDVTIHSFGIEGEKVKRVPGGLGSVYTPDRILVETTSVYSRIGFPVKGIFGTELFAVKEKTVDIVGGQQMRKGGA